MSVDLFNKEWRFAKPTWTCAQCRRELQEREEGFASLVEAGEAFERREHCAPCWGNVEPKGFSHWKFRRPEDHEEKIPQASPEALYDFFTHLAGKEETEDRVLRYLLGLFLVRKKFLKLEKMESRMEGERLLVRRGKDPEVFEATTGPLQPEQLEAAQQRLEILVGLKQQKAMPPAPQPEPVAAVEITG